MLRTHRKLPKKCNFDTYLINIINQIQLTNPFSRIFIFDGSGNRDILQKALINNDAPPKEIATQS